MLEKAGVMTVYSRGVEPSTLEVEMYNFPYTFCTFLITETELDIFTSHMRHEDNNGIYLYICAYIMLKM